MNRLCIVDLGKALGPDGTLEGAAESRSDLPQMLAQTPPTFIQGIVCRRFVGRHRRHRVDREAHLITGI